MTNMQSCNKLLLFGVVASASLLVVKDPKVIFMILILVLVLYIIYTNNKIPESFDSDILDGPILHVPTCQPDATPEHESTPQQIDADPRTAEEQLIASRINRDKRQASDSYSTVNQALKEMQMAELDHEEKRSWY